MGSKSPAVPHQRHGTSSAAGTVPPRSLRLGAHMSIAGGHEKSIERALSVGCETIQIFSKSNNQWDAPPITAEQAQRFQQAVSKSGMGPVFAHTAYLINVGSPEKAVWSRSRSALKTEIERATALGLPFIVHHPGSHKETGEEAGIRRIAEAARWVIEQTPKSKVKILFEIAAGQGACIGHRFEHLAELLEKTDCPDRTGICLDTCHLFAAGYDIRTKTAYEKTMHELDQIVGIGQVQAIHLNDSKKELGCRVDRHEHIGRGQIGLEAFRCLLNDKRFARVPMVLETPKDEECTEDRMNLNVLRGLLN